MYVCTYVCMYNMQARNDVTGLVEHSLSCMIEENTHMQQIIIIIIMYMDNHEHHRATL